MRQIDIGEAAFAGFAILRRRPFAALTWAIVWAVFLAVFIVLFGGLIVTFVQAWQGMAAKGGKPNVSLILSMVAGVVGAYLVLIAGALSVGSVVSCAVIRSVLDPADAACAYLRLGRREFRMLLLQLCIALLSMVASLIMSMLLAILTFAVIAAHGTASSVLIGLRIPAQLIINGVSFYLFLRFSLAAPMTFDEQRFRLFESWTLTKGHVWRLFLIGLLVFVMAMVTYFVVVLIGAAGGFALWRDVPGLADPKTFFSRPPGEWLRALAPIIVLVSILGVALIAILTPLGVAPWARAYRQLRPENDIAATFA